MLTGHGFILAGLAFQKMTEYDDFVEAARTHSVVGLSFNLVMIGTVVALLAVLAGGLPIAIAVIRSALTQKRRAPLLLLAVPILATRPLRSSCFLPQSPRRSLHARTHSRPAQSPGPT